MLVFLFFAWTSDPLFLAFSYNRGARRKVPRVCHIREKLFGLLHCS
jgi:hypothetical protein